MTMCDVVWCTEPVHGIVDDLGYCTEHWIDMVNCVTEHRKYLDYKPLSILRPGRFVTLGDYFGLRSEGLNDGKETTEEYGQQEQREDDEGEYR